MSAINTFTEKIVGASEPIYCHLTVPVQKGPLVLYLAEDAMSPPMGSLVYSLYSNSQIVSTNLFHQEDTIKVAQRVSNALAKKLQRPVIVGSSVQKGDNLMVLKSVMEFVESKLTS
jgi:hypothetical protein